MESFKNKKTNVISFKPTAEDIEKRKMEEKIKILERRIDKLEKLVNQLIMKEGN